MEWIIIGSAAAIVVALVLCAREIRLALSHVQRELSASGRNIANTLSRLAAEIGEDRALRQSLANMGGDRCRCYIAPMTADTATEEDTEENDDPVYARIGAPVRESTLRAMDRNPRLVRERTEDAMAFEVWLDERAAAGESLRYDRAALIRWAEHLQDAEECSAYNAARRARNVEMHNAWADAGDPMRGLPF